MSVDCPGEIAPMPVQDYLVIMDWDDVRIFLAAVRTGSLRAAARDLGLSQPTVGRRLSRFEHEVTGGPLFEKHPHGLQLTARGSSILVIAEDIENAALALQRRLAMPSDNGGSVRISCGEWAAHFMAPRLRTKGSPNALPDDVVPELMQSDKTANLTKRAADMAVRHGRPDTGDLYVSTLGVISCAVYSSAVNAPSPGAWVSYSSEQAYYLSTQWSMDQIAKDPKGHFALRASTLSAQLTAIRAGAGIGVVPCYLGDTDTTLMRVSRVVPELEAVHWLIVHRDLRDLPRVQAVIRCVRGMFEADRPLLEGRAVN